MDATAEKQRLADVPAFPECLSHVWAWFVSLDAKRQSGMGVNPISYTEMAEWARLTRQKPSPFEVRCLDTLDRVRMRHAG